MEGCASLSDPIKPTSQDFDFFNTSLEEFSIVVMRFLNTETLRFEHVLDSELHLEENRYAMLSHRWGPQEEEVSLEDILSSAGISHKKGFEKLKGFCTVASRLHPREVVVTAGLTRVVSTREIRSNWPKRSIACTSGIGTVKFTLCISRTCLKSS